MTKWNVLNILMNSLAEPHNSENKKELICEILGISDEEKMSSQEVEMPIVEPITPEPAPFPFIMRPKYTEEETEIILQVMYNLVKLAIGEGEDLSQLRPGHLSGVQEDAYEDSKSESSESFASQSVGSKDETDNKSPPFIIVLDNAHMMDPASWELYEAIRDGCKRIVLILILQTDYNDSLKISPGSREVFDRIWSAPVMEDNRVIELPRFSIDNLESMLVGNAQRYFDTYMSEVDRMTEIINPNNTIKTVE